MAFVILKRLLLLGAISTSPALAKSTCVYKDVPACKDAASDHAQLLQKLPEGACKEQADCVMLEYRSPGEFCVMPSFALRRGSLKKEMKAKLDRSLAKVDKACAGDTSGCQEGNCEVNSGKRVYCHYKTCVLASPEDALGAALQLHAEELKARPPLADAEAAAKIAEGKALLARKDWQKAKALLSAFIPVAPEIDAARRFHLARALLRLGDTAGAQALNATAGELDTALKIPGLYNNLCAFALSSGRKEAFEALKRLRAELVEDEVGETRKRFVALLEKDADLASIRNDPRFDKALKALRSVRPEE